MKEMSPHPVYTDIENIISYCSWSKYFDNKYEFPGQALIFIYIDHPGECLLNSTNIAVISSSYGMILRFWWNIVLVEFSFLFRFYLDYAVAKSVQELILWMTRYSDSKSSFVSCHSSFHKCTWTWACFSRQKKLLSAEMLLCTYVK